MLRLDDNTIEKIEMALNKNGPIKILIEKNLKGKVTLEITEKYLLREDN